MTRAEARRRRFERGCCPTHGLFMPQVGGWRDDGAGREVTRVGCPRRDCSFEADAYSIDGPWVNPSEQIEPARVLAFQRPARKEAAA